jgi:putative MATE family efflux protein
MKKADDFGTQPLGKLLRQQAFPASIGILIMSLYGIIDTIFVGHFVGPEAIGAITVVLPIVFLMASIGMSIGVGGASVLSRSLGAKDHNKAMVTFGNQVLLTLGLVTFFLFFGYFFMDDVIRIFGGNGAIHQPAIDYFEIILIGVPFFAFSMMAVNVIRSEGYPRVAMMLMIVPAILNIILDPILILWLEMGIQGAAWATTIAYMGSAVFALGHFLSNRSMMSLKLEYLRFNWGISKEIVSLGSITFARQGVISLLALVLNNSLFHYGGEEGLAIYGIVHRILMFANFPVLGITQGFIPIVGYNFGAKNKDRVRKIVRMSIIWASAIAMLIFVFLMLASDYISVLFTSDKTLIRDTGPALRMVFLATPLLAVSLIVSAYFQAIGRALPALLLALTKQGFLLIPLVLILPLVWGINGIWLSFPIADLGAAIISYIYYKTSNTVYSDQTVDVNPDIDFPS